MKKFTILFILSMLFSFSISAQTFPVELTIVDPGRELTGIQCKGEWDSWTTHPMVSDGNPNPTTWTVTLDMAAGTYEWGAEDDGANWLLNLPFGTHTGNLSITVDGSGVVTGENTFTLNDPGTKTIVFSVDMNAVGGFIPGSDNVDLTGDFSGWNTNSFYNMTDPEVDGIYEVASPLDFNIDDVIAFKFRINTGATWEGISDRTYTVIDGANTYCAAFDVEGNTCDPTSVSDTEINKFTISPNPVTDVINITYNEEISKITVYNLTGQKIMSVMNNTAVDVSSLNFGIYFLQIQNKKGNLITKKFIKE